MKKGVRIYLRLFTYIKRYWIAFAVAIFGHVLYALVDAGFIKFLEPLLNEGFVGRNQAFIRWIPTIIIAIFVLRGFAGFLSTYFMGWVGRKIVAQFREELFSKILTLPAKFFDKRTVGELISKITFDVEQVALASTDALTILVRELATAIALLGVMFSISWRLSLLFLAIVPVMAVLIHFVSGRSRRLSSRIQQSMADVTHVSGEAIEGHLEVRLFGAQEKEKTRFSKVTHNNRHQEMKLITTTALTVPVVQLFGALALALTIYLATSDPVGAGQSAVTPGGFTAFIAAMIALLKPVKQLTKVNAKIQRGLAGAQSIFQLLDEDTELDNGQESISSIKGHLVFEKVRFAYDRDKQDVLRSISFEVEPGQTVAIVGRSGSGKSTLAKLLPRFYDYEGSITLDGVPLKQLPLKILRDQISYVSQDITLFNTTIAENIAYAKLNATESEIIEAAKFAHAWNFIQSFPSGLETVVGERGLTLSGGQRQRIAIARAILKNAPLLILDEATSALDAESEGFIQEALEALGQSKTTLIIAHRLSTIEKADKIVVLDNGVVSEIGSHTQLINENGQYASLRKLQSLESIPKVNEKFSAQVGGEM